MLFFISIYYGVFVSKGNTLQFDLDAVGGGRRERDMWHVHTYLEVQVPTPSSTT